MKHQGALALIATTALLAGCGGASSGSGSAKSADTKTVTSTVTVTETASPTSAPQAGAYVPITTAPGEPRPHDATEDPTDPEDKSFLARVRADLPGLDIADDASLVGLAKLACLSLEKDMSMEEVVRFNAVNANMELPKISWDVSGSTIFVNDAREVYCSALNTELP